jgi:hypothetical protein
MVHSTSPLRDAECGKQSWSVMTDKMQRTFNRHNEICNGGFCCLSVLEDCLVQCLAECIVSRQFDEIGVIETGAEGMR